MRTDYSLKADLYDSYRWNYPDEAIEIIKHKCKLQKETIAADFGAGTGKLTQHFENSVHKIYAIEPDENMAAIMERKAIKNARIIKKYSHEVTEIHKGELDVILTGHALHWFDYEKTIRVFRAILKKTGYIVSINNSYTDDNRVYKEIGNTLRMYVKQEINGKKDLDTDKYFLPGSIEKYIIPFAFMQSFEELLHGLSSASYYPDNSDGETYEKFKSDLEKLFVKYGKDGKIVHDCLCTVCIGTLSY